MGLRGKEVGVRQRFDYRSGVGKHPPIRGMNKQDDPAAVPTWQHEHIENAYLTGGAILSRGGQSKLNSSGAGSGCIIGIHDDVGATGGGGLSIYGASATDMSVFSSGYTPKDTAIDTGGITTNLILHNDLYVYYGAGDKLYKMATGADPSKLTAGTVVTQASTNLTNVATAHGIIYLLAGNNVYTWDNQTLALDDTSGATCTNIFCLAQFREDTFALYDNAIRRKHEGVWATVAAPITGWTGQYIIPYKDKLYFVVNDYDVTEFVGTSIATVLVWDGTSLTTSATFTDSGNSTYGFGAAIGPDGNLYVNWIKAASSGIGVSQLAQFNGTTWANTAVTLTGVSGVGARCYVSYVWVTYKGDWYYVGDNTDFPGSETDPMVGIRKATSVTSATYTLVNDGATIYAGGVVA